ncbi:hypothetical protein Pelo_14606 [Pelomyxa schiedti]|nr:hypothetical protein Pelo_14606 [Pelomyxa schiedti]
MASVAAPSGTSTGEVVTVGALTFVVHVMDATAYVERDLRPLPARRGARRTAPGLEGPLDTSCGVVGLLIPNYDYQPLPPVSSRACWPQSQSQSQSQSHPVEDLHARSLGSDERHEAVGGTLITAIEYWGSLVGVGSAVQMALSVACTCRLMRKLIDSADCMWRAFVDSHCGIPSVEFATKRARPSPGLWKTLYMVLCAHANNRRPMFHCRCISGAENSKNGLPTTIPPAEIPLRGTFLKPGCVTMQQNKINIPIRTRRNQVNVSFDYGPHNLQPPPLINYCVIDRWLQCHPNGAEWIDIHMDGRSFLLQIPKRCFASLTIAPVNVMHTGDAQLSLLPMAHSVFTGESIPIETTAFTLTCFLEYSTADRKINTEHQVRIHSRLLLPPELNAPWSFYETELEPFKTTFTLPPINETGTEIHAINLIKVDAPDFFDACNLPQTVAPIYPTPILLSPPLIRYDGGNECLRFQVGSTPPCPLAPYIEVKNLASGEILWPKLQAQPSSTGEWWYSATISQRCIEVEATGKYLAGRHSQLFKFYIPLYYADIHVIYSKGSYLVFSLTLFKNGTKCKDIQCEPAKASLVSPDNTPTNEIIWMTHTLDATAAGMVRAQPGKYSLVVSSTTYSPDPNRTLGTAEIQVEAQSACDLACENAELRARDCHECTWCQELTQHRCVWTCEECREILCERCSPRIRDNHRHRVVMLRPISGHCWWCHAPVHVADPVLIDESTQSTVCLGCIPKCHNLRRLSLMLQP